MDNRLKKIDEAVSYLREKISEIPSIGITLGSGLTDLAQSISLEKEIPYKDIPHFQSCSVSGHKGQIIFGKIENRPVALLQGRLHLYEGYSLEDVILPTRVLGRLGIKTLVLTNSSGGMGDAMEPGDFMVITDQINLTGENPLMGVNINELGTRFPPMNEVYSLRLREKILKILKDEKLRHSCGIYCGVKGPSYETPAEVKFIKHIGASAVGMSTVFEAIAAKHMGIEVCGISCITNLASGMGKDLTTHKEVKEVAQRTAKDFCRIIKKLIPVL